MKSYSIRLVKSPPKESFSVAVQQAILGGDQSAETWYKLNNSSFMKNVDRYIAKHEIKVNRSGRAHGQYFSYYYEPHNFPFYHDKKRNLIYISAKKDVVKSFINHASLSKEWPPVPINYVAMAPILPKITGAWFCELKLQYVSSAGYFGQHVDRSEEFKKAASCGQISVLYINISPPFGGLEFRVGITSEGAVVLSQKLELEEQEIELVSHVYDTYIAPTQEA